MLYVILFIRIHRGKFKIPLVTRREFPNDLYTPATSIPSWKYGLNGLTYKFLSISMTNRRILYDKGKSVFLFSLNN